MKEFVILRHGKPLLFGLELVGVTWVSPLVFERPIEKLGGGLQLFWDGEFYDDDKPRVTRLVAHWKKMLTRRAKKLNVPVSQVVDMEEWEPKELQELLVSVDPGQKTVDASVFRTAEGFELRLRLFISGNLRLEETLIRTSREEVRSELHRFILKVKGVDPRAVGIHEYLAPLAFELHGRTDSEAQAILDAAHFAWQQKPRD